MVSLSLFPRAILPHLTHLHARTLPYSSLLFLLRCSLNRSLTLTLPNSLSFAARASIFAVASSALFLLHPCCRTLEDRRSPPLPVR